MANNRGDAVLYTGSTGRTHGAILLGVDGSDNASLFVFPDDPTIFFEDGHSDDFEVYDSIPLDLGAGNTTWRPSPTIPDAIAALAMTAAPALSTPSRVLGTAFQPSATRPVLGIYSARVVSVLSVSGGQAGRVELVSDASNPPTTVRARVTGGITGTLALGLSLTDTSESPLVHLYRPGDFGLLRGVNETSAPTYSLGAQVEIVL